MYYNSMAIIVVICRQRTKGWRSAAEGVLMLLLLLALSEPRGWLAGWLAVEALGGDSDKQRLIRSDR